MIQERPLLSRNQPQDALSNQLKEEVQRVELEE